MTTYFRFVAILSLFIINCEKILTERCCQDGWAVAPDLKMCFKVFENALNWFDAENFCSGQSGKLVSIHNAFQNSIIWQLIASTNGNIDYAWLGSTTTHPAAGDLSGWYWHDGSPFDFAHFAPGEPNNWNGCPAPDVTQSCLAMWIHASGANGKWDDGCCHSLHPFVCEKLASTLGCTLI